MYVVVILLFHFSRTAALSIWTAAPTDFGWLVWGFRWRLPQFLNRRRHHRHGVPFSVIQRSRLHPRSRLLCSKIRMIVSIETISCTEDRKNQSGSPCRNRHLRPSRKDSQIYYSISHDGRALCPNLVQTFSLVVLLVINHSGKTGVVNDLVISRLIDWLIDWLIAWLIDRLIDQPLDWLFAWLIDCFYFSRQIPPLIPLNYTMILNLLLFPKYFYLWTISYSIFFDIFFYNFLKYQIITA